MFKINYLTKKAIGITVLYGALTALLLFVSRYYLEFMWLERGVLFLGGDFLAGGYIQMGTIFCFSLAMLKILESDKFIRNQRRDLKLNFLPKNNKIILLDQDINEIRVKTIENNIDSSLSIINQIIVRACTKYRSSKSIPEMMEITSSQVEFFSSKSYVEQSLIRYFIWCIPSIGFIGTIIGISEALSLSSSGNLPLITGALGVAFDTTLLSLILSIVINWKYNTLVDKTDSLYLKIGQIITDKLINRIENETQAS